MGRAGVAGCIVAVIASICAHGATAAVAAPRKAGEQELKAAYVVKFLEFVTWPEPMDRLTICTADDDALATELERLVSAKSIDGVPVVVSRRTNGGDFAGCAAMVVGASASLPRTVATEPILTIGNGVGFAEDGGVIGFYIERGLLHFAINARAAAAARLRISSHLLRLGRIVETRRTEP